MIPSARWRLGAGLGGAVRLHGERVERMAARHIEPVVLRAAEAQIGAALRQPDEADRLTLRVEYLHAVQDLEFALQRKDFAVVDVRRFIVERAVAAPSTPEIAVPVDPKAVERP